MYDLHQLGWYSFQQLSTTVTREVFGQSSMSFVSTGDGGRDGYFTGDWQYTANENVSGKFVFQCKFTSKQSKKLQYSELESEYIKIRKLVLDGLCDIYILITNLSVRAPVHSKVENKILSLGVKRVFILGAEWLCDIIKENTRLRRLVPRLYGLGDLSQILDERVYAQGRALLNSLKDELSKVVITTAYNKAAEALDKHKFILLIGEPAAGKTTIASMLAMGALDQWKSTAMKLDTAEKVIDHWNPEDPQQFFWIDDAFGVTQYESNLVAQWNHKFPEIKAMMNDGARIVMTSRDYIYNRARNELKVSAFPLLKESQVVIDVQNLSLNEKRQMLYNHIKMGDQDLEFKKKIKPFLESIAAAPKFVPETARRLASPIFTQGLYFYQWHIDEFVDKQEEFLIDVINGLDKDSVGALAIIYMNNDSLNCPINLKPEEELALKRLNSSLGGCTTALTDLRGNIVQYVTDNDGSYWKYKHPTIGDAFSKIVAKSPELIEIYLHGSPVNKLITQITCGDVGLENAIVVHKNNFTIISNKLKSFTSTNDYKSEILKSWGARQSALSFLATRCTGSFLIEYLSNDIQILEELSKLSYILEYSPEINLAYRLFELNLLPEENRRNLIKTISEYAINGKSFYSLKSDKILAMFQKQELETLKTRIKTELVPTIHDLTLRYQNEFESSKKDPEEHMEKLIETLNILKTEFNDDIRTISLLDNEITITKKWISENGSDKKTTPDRSSLADDSEIEIFNPVRSIFDDIDQ